jgi:DNA polymerase
MSQEGAIFRQSAYSPSRTSALAGLPMTEAKRRGDAAALKAVIAEAARCRRCPLYANATQTVFGEGAPGAGIMFVGEQPGDKEDIAGRPFVGPAGKLLDRALADADIARADAYVTNAVKHFKNEPRGKRRIHKKPNASEIEQCRWWLEREIAIVKPALLVALGSTAARALLGRDAKVLKERGRVATGAAGVPVFITIHPSALLRIDDADQRHAEFRRFLADMNAVKRWRMRQAV